MNPIIQSSLMHEVAKTCVPHLAILTVSDRASQGSYIDVSGPALQKLAQHLGYYVAAQAVVADDMLTIQQFVQEQVNQDVAMIWLTGGTGASPRDVSPEAVSALAQRHIPGIGEYMRLRSFEITSMAALSRCGGYVVGETLVLLLPGKPKAAVECVEFVADILPHALRQIRGVQDHIHDQG